MKPSGYYTKTTFNIQQFYVLPTQCICVLCGCHNKQRLFPYTALTDFYNRFRDCLLRGMSWIYIHNSDPFKAQWLLYVPHSGHYMYHQFNIHKSYVLSTQCIFVFCVDLRTNSAYLAVQH
jgi:hypothetical protein